MIQSQAKPHPKTMAKQELEKEEEEEKKKNGTKERPNKKEVIITVYVESPSPSSASHSHQKTDQFKKIKPNQNSRKPHQMAKTGGYDRRAHLLAYAQELRTTGGSQQVQWPKSGSKPKLRVGGKRFTTPVRLRRTKNKWRYQRLVPEVDISCNPKSIICGNKKATGSEPNSNFLRKLRGVVKGLSWHCNKGSKVAEKNHAV
ncbi:hypothetical protein PRUPE_1G505500 [Prunus persica]|uniref:Uncharacterized protein n=1 Tax=Prunus persica TaxID=3760 RepID=A0A251RFV7_PRUPE|nr:uncharacterized protein LOC109946538 isoform X2 [Prunus persica]ONI34911.1 hypothetical protein PRUPE_1G505500 [Prunus persica]